MTATVPPPTAPRLVRRREDRVLGGVAAGLAEHLSLPVLWVRLAFVALLVGGGAGLLLYGAYWLALPQAGADEARLSDRSAGELLLLGAAAVAGVVVLDLVAVPGPVLVPLAAVAAGAALVWRQADDVRRARWRETAVRRRGGVLLSGLGVVLVVLGLAGFLAARGELQAAREGLVATVVVVGGLALLLAPWASRTLGELRAERYERVRSQERAELAAQVHDSVLQTLALIQASAADPREVVRLARSQERALRGWLYRPAAGPVPLLGAVLEQAAGEVEDDFGVPVEVVHVGDVPHDGAVVALASAAREAVVNAAKHSGAPSVQVYAEVEDAAVTVFVRDRGRGFDPSAVPADRYGLQESVVGRVERAGGTVRVRSAPGEGTEVQLQVPREGAR
ncbi:MAG TPA: PspC domain-containing protein [Mycobacteriales bacterium]|nr:PspC domain-containing protein [Mycobacteriales bacterium]